MTGIEVCTGSIGDSLRASKAGASRLELNSALEVGGISPSAGVVDEVVESVAIPVLVMVRPRSGDFVYTPAEKRSMLRDMQLFLDLGATGIVFGALLPSCEVDIQFVSEVREEFQGVELVFSRAFDLAPDMFTAAELIADHGLNRILTSGGESTALRGMDVIRDLNREYGSRLDILPGSGITSVNAAQIVNHTGCGWIHGSFSKQQTAGSDPGDIMPLAAPGTSMEEIALVRNVLNVKMQNTGSR